MYEILNMFGLKIKFSIKVIFNSFNYSLNCLFILWFNLICKYTKLHKFILSLITSFINRTLIEIMWIC